MPLEKGMPMEYRLETIVEQEDQREIFLYEGRGQIVKMGEWLYLRYEEEGTNNRVTIKLSRPGKVTIIRRDAAALSSRLSFEAKGKGNGQIPAGEGILELETVTHHMLMNFQEKPFAGTVQMEYSLGNMGHPMGKYTMTLHFTT